MIVLAVETSSRWFGLAIADGTRVLAEQTRLRDQEHPGIGAAAAHLLAGSGLAVSDLGRLAVDVGPGNLGTVRSGIAYVNGLAFALGLRVAGVDALDLLARVPLAVHGEPVLCLRAAGGARVYAGLFHPDGDVVRTSGPLAEVVPALAAALPRVVLAGVHQDRAAAALPGIEAIASGIEVPVVGTLVTAVADRDPGTDVDAVSPLTEHSPAYA